jgi:hypothetical protein
MGPSTSVGRLLLIAVPGKNDTAEEMPQGAIVELTTSVKIDNEVVRVGRKPSTTFRLLYMVNLFKLQPGQKGLFIPPGFECPVLYTGTAPTEGQSYGPTPGQWHATQFQPEIARCTASVDTTNNIAMMQLMWPLAGVIKNTTGSNVAANANGDFQIQKTATVGSEADAGFSNVPMRNRGSIAFNNNKIGGFAILNGRFYAMPWECP